MSVGKAGLQNDEAGSVKRGGAFVRRLAVRNEVLF